MYYKKKLTPFQELYCQKQPNQGNPGDYYTLSQKYNTVYSTKSPSCQDGRGNSLWFNPPNALSFCNRVKSGSFKGYDSTFGINRGNQSCKITRD